MEITTLSGLLRIGSVKELTRGIGLRVLRSMIIAGEDRLSYSTIIRLVECTREHHWQKDILSLSKDTQQLDSICKSLSADFKQPIFVGSEILITYSITGVRRKSYNLRFQVHTESTKRPHSLIEMICVFYDPIMRKISTPPQSVISRLTEIQENDAARRDDGAFPNNIII